MSKEQLYHYNDTIDQLQQENEQLKKEIAEYKEVLETYKKKPVNIYQVEIRNLQVDKAELKLEIEKLKDKLKRTEKAIDELLFEKRNFGGLIEKVSEQAQKNLRHEICEDIMNKIDEKFNCCGYIEDIKFEDFKKIILNQIEGEK